MAFPQFHLLNKLLTSNVLSIKTLFKLRLISNKFCNLCNANLCRKSFISFPDQCLSIDALDILTPYLVEDCLIVISLLSPHRYPLVNSESLIDSLASLPSNILIKFLPAKSHAQLSRKVRRLIIHRLSHKVITLDVTIHDLSSHKHTVFPYVTSLWISLFSQSDISQWPGVSSRFPCLKELIITCCCNCSENVSTLMNVLSTDLVLSTLTSLQFKSNGCPDEFEPHCLHILPHVLSKAPRVCHFSSSISHSVSEFILAATSFLSRLRSLAVVNITPSLLSRLNPQELFKLSGSIKNDKTFDLLLRLSNLSVLNLTIEVIPSSFTFFSFLVHLKSLSLRFSFPLSNDYLSNLFQQHLPKHLDSLDFTGTLTNDVFSLIAQNLSLTHLSLSNESDHEDTFSGDDFIYLISNSVYLRSLSLSNFHIILGSSFVSQTLKLSSLVLSHCIIACTLIRNVVMCSPRLRELDLPSTPFLVSFKFVELLESNKHIDSVFFDSYQDEELGASKIMFELFEKRRFMTKIPFKSVRNRDGGIPLILI
ncbi:hypothetical protein GEMRC1_010689 [Eukaryota sp. GEM-RC1]